MHKRMAHGEDPGDDEEYVRVLGRYLFMLLSGEVFVDVIK